MKRGAIASAGLAKKKAKGNRSPAETEVYAIPSGKDEGGK